MEEKVMSKRKKAAEKPDEKADRPQKPPRPLDPFAVASHVKAGPDTVIISCCN
jgi:hypothetical protein